MKIYLMTDLEGVAGVIDFENWCFPDGRYYEDGRRLLTLEVNAAVDGFLAGGATEIVVADGHGYGAVNIELLDPRAKLMRGWPTGYPLLLDKTYDALAFVGQHAKAGTEFAHLAHTGDVDAIDWSINGISIGELGKTAMCASELGIRTIFASGDEALTKEAQALLPGIETVSVKTGTTPGKGDELPYLAYQKRNTSAIHLQPVKAREQIRSGALKAVQRAQKEKFGLIPLKPPFERVVVFRSDRMNPVGTYRHTHPDSVSALLNTPFHRTTVV